jgi:hypothetical protein
MAAARRGRAVCTKVSWLRGAIRDTPRYLRHAISSTRYRAPNWRGSISGGPRCAARLAQAIALLSRKKIWSGRRGSNPRPRPWQGRALPLSYTRIREIGGDRSPATGRAMPNAARECNRPRCAREQAWSTGHNSAISPQISPKAAGWGSADCKLSPQAPIRAGTC